MSTIPRPKDRFDVDAELVEDVEIVDGTRYDAIIHGEPQTQLRYSQMPGVEAVFDAETSAKVVADDGSEYDLEVEIHVNEEDLHDQLASVRSENDQVYARVDGEASSRTAEGAAREISGEGTLDESGVIVGVYEIIGAREDTRIGTYTPDKGIVLYQEHSNLADMEAALEEPETTQL